MKSVNKKGVWVAVIWLLGLYIIGSDGLKDVSLDSSNYVRRGEDLHLKCRYDTESESLYALKWYRGSEEFYRYLPKEVPPSQAFPIAGVVVDLNKSDDHNVILKNASSATNGKYKCVVSAEGNFQTIFDSKDISVVSIGYDSPKLYLEKLSYHPGELGRANCTLEKTSPPANITWAINNDKVELRHVLTRVHEDPLDPNLTSTFSMLTFTVSPSSYAPMTIKCTGELHDLYKETSSIQIQPKAPTYSSNFGIPDTLQRINATLRGSAASRFPGETYLSHLFTAQLVYTFLMIRLRDMIDCPHIS